MDPYYKGEDELGSEAWGFFGGKVEYLDEKGRVDLSAAIEEPM